ncbi:hypothetical protein RUM44_006927 [Polyplax serrata]|uniref:Mitochondrial mRNA-processing protein COX24 C-terminal domain-containing protein n=1 Tax=Polyplax serrata TaxID=468196 RepID=A0ABR1AZB1_POLSC
MNLGNNTKKLVSHINSSLKFIQIKGLKLVDGKTTPLKGSLGVAQVKPTLMDQRKLSGENVKFFKMIHPIMQLESQLNLLGSSRNILIPPIPGWQKINEPDFNKKGKIEVPLSTITHGSLELPCNVEQEKIEPVKNIISKKAVYMIRVRRRKMRIHKLKKLRKRNKYIYAKIKAQRRAAKKAAFEAKLKEIENEGKTFNPEKHLEDMLAKLNWEPPVTKARGRLAPKWVIKQEQARIEFERVINERIEECLSKNKI